MSSNFTDFIFLNEFMVLTAAENQIQEIIAEQSNLVFR